MVLCYLGMICHLISVLLCFRDISVTASMSFCSSGAEKSETSRGKMMRPKADVMSKRRPACSVTAPPSTLTSHIPPAGVILVRPATAENTLLLEGQGSKVR